MGYFVTPTSGQRQVPGTSQSLARILLNRSSLDFVTTEFTADGGPISVSPDAGYICWRYLFQNVERYGSKLPIQLSDQYIMTDIASLPITDLLVVLRSGVSASISIRRVSL